ncbi:MAG: prolipoprotein diacylglyceryl transferase [Rhodospirillaceae bacterium]|nr:prolipoprotein diacylglyceryl transferase [Rhodospirillaceae bacterium]
MSLLALTFPTIDPVLIEIGPFAIRWYALAYIAGLFGGTWYMRKLVAKPPALITPERADDFLIWALIGVILGGRLGYVLFYKPAYYLSNPGEILMTWEGGMSFHGGLIGVTLAIILFARKLNVDKWYVADNVSCAVPIGLLLGRIANFINGELYGRAAPEVSWAMAFPGGGTTPRHPSQLYEAVLEGLVLFVILNLLWRNDAVRDRPGIITGCFCAGYAIARIIVEFFREPDRHLGFLAFGLTMGQILSGALLLFGAWVIRRSLRRSPLSK